MIDVFDAASLTAALVRVAPWGVIHRPADLPPKLDSQTMGDAVTRNARVRAVGSRHPVAAAEAGGAAGLVAQSIDWVYAPGRKPCADDVPLDMAAVGTRAVTVGSVVAALERSVFAIGMVATVLRYGQLDAPGTSIATPNGASPMHVEAAAWAGLPGLQCSPGGVSNGGE